MPGLHLTKPYGAQIIGNSEIDPDWTCRDYVQSDVEAILELFSIVYGKRRSTRLWNWQCLLAPAGRAFVKLLFGDGRLIGHYAAVPVGLSVAGRTARAILSIDTMVHPSYRGRGIFTYLAALIYKESAAAGYELVYGFPNKNSYFGFVTKLGWIGFGNINAFAVDADKLRTHSSEVSSRVVRLVEFDETADELWECCRNRNMVCVKRGRSYLNWRYVAKPDVSHTLFGLRDSLGRLEGYAVTKLYQTGSGLIGHIIDILCRNEEQLPMLLRACYSELISKRVSRITCWIGDSSSVARQLFSDGFRCEVMETYFGVKLMLTTPEVAYAGNFRNWHITMGDSDVF